MKIFVCGNCQTDQIVVALRALSADHQATGLPYKEEHWGEGVRSAVISEARAADFFLTNLSPKRFARHIDPAKIVQFPDVVFFGFHPDLIQIKGLSKRDGKPAGPGIKYSGPHAQQASQWPSAIALWAFKSGLTAERAFGLFRPEVFREMGYFRAYADGIAALRTSFAMMGLSADGLDRLKGDVFMWGPAHPKMSVALAVGAALLEKLGVRAEPADSGLHDLLPDPLAAEYAYGCSPPIADELGVGGSWRSRIGTNMYPNQGAFIADSFRAFDLFQRESLQIHFGLVNYEGMDAVLSGFK